MKVIPNIYKEKLEEAQEILKKEGIKYKEVEEKEFSFNVKRGRVIRTDPEIGKIIKKDEEVTIFVSRLWLFPIFLIFLIGILSMLASISLSNMYTSNKPLIARKGSGWEKIDLVYITKDVDIERLDTYEYCISETKNTKKCDWQITKTKNVVISETGIWYVTFRANYKDGKKSFNSNRVTVYVDNDAPVVHDIDKREKSTSLSFVIKATDKGSGINKYYYKVGDNEWKETNKTFTIEELEPDKDYDIVVRVEDKAGNIYDIEFTAKTTPSDDNNNSNDKCDKNCDTNGDGKCDLNCDTNGDGKCDLNCNGNTNSTTTTTRPKTSTTRPTTSSNNNNDDNEVESSDNEKTEIPKVDLLDVPAVFTFGSYYKLPSHVTYGPSGGTVSCVVSGLEYKDTTTLGIGTHTIVCTAISNKGGSKAKTSKQVEVKMTEGNDELIDGWIRLNLYYPAGSTNWEWRIGKEGEIRDGYDFTGWQPYTGPILVRVRDVQDIWIRYDLNGATITVPPSDRLLVEIIPEKFTLTGDETTKVTILCDDTADKCEYKIGAEDWTEYKGEFEVGKNTLIEARVTKKETIYDSTGAPLLDKIKKNTDSVWISELIINNQTTPGSGNTGNGNNQGESGETDPNNPGSGNQGGEGETNPSNPGNGNQGGSGEIDPSNPGSGNQGGSGDNGPSKPEGGDNSGNGSSSGGHDGDITYHPSVDENGNGHTKPNDDEKPSTYLTGPIITSNPSSGTVESTKVSITTEFEARTIYIKVGDGNWQVYTNEIEISSNGAISAFYIRDSDGLKSDTSYYEVKNIKSKNLPYVRIDVTPGTYLSEKLESVQVSVSGKDYNTLEYSFDGVLYEKYTSPITITQSTNFYAKGTNQYGSTVEKITITTKEAPTPKVNLDVLINVYPDETLEEIAQVEVTINYDSRATTKKYRIGTTGELRDYNGPFTVNENTTIYAYATSSNGTGSASKAINHLTTGVAEPLIRVEPTETTEIVIVHIDYAKTSIEKKYKIGNGEWQNYDGPFEVEENIMIYAKNKDSLNHEATSEYYIKNIGKIPRYSVIDKGKYYIIKLNYPSISTPEKREYKYKQEGTWKVYNPQGILLIKAEYKDDIDTTVDGYKVEDETGKDIIFTDNYYILDVPLEVAAANIFMRWDAAKPAAPQIILSEDGWTRSLNVGIIYAAGTINQQYRIISPDGNDTDWIPYSGLFTIEENNVIIYAKSDSSTKIESYIGSKKVTNIDRITPIVSNVIEKDITTKTLGVIVTATDSQSGVDYYEYSIDGEIYKKSINNEYTFTNLKANIEYTVYIKVTDKVGNKSKPYEFTYTTNELAKPEINVEPSLDVWSSSKEITIRHVNSEMKLYYSLNNGRTWKEYNDRFTIEENTSIIAKVTDGISETLSDTLNITSIDATAPIINDVRVTGKSSRLIVNVDASDPDSGILKYYYSLDGEDFIESESNQYSFGGLTVNTNYNIYIQAKNLAGVISEVYKTNGSTIDIGNIDYELDKETWAYEKYVTIYYPSEEGDTYQRQYSFDNGDTWLNYTGPVLVNKENQNIVARVVDGDNIKVASSFTITKIDSTVPTVSLSALPASFYTSDEYSLPSSYFYDETKSGGSVSCNVNGVNYTSTTELPGGSYTIYCTVTTGAGKTASVSKNVTVTMRGLIKADSVLKAMQQDLKDGYYIFRITAGSTKIDYLTHVYVYDGDQVWTSNMQFGTSVDVATSASTNASSMVVVKVNGNLTINSGVTVYPYYTAYGGPKGFSIFVTGKLTNNGVINNTHGAKSGGQNVYLWKNENATYEYVPATGGSGAAGNSGSYGQNGKTGGVGGARATGGGGGGSNGQGIKTSGGGSAGTSYSGGTGGGGDVSTSVSSRNGTANGGAGGTGGGTLGGGGGAGNPGGSNGGGSGKVGSSGTGGLLIIYANVYENNNTITANGSTGGVGGNYGGGGSSGGGSVNIFYNTLIKQGTATANGGAGVSKSGRTSGAGGAGHVTYKQIDISYDYKEPVYTPTVKLSTSKWTTNKTITITYSNGYINEYSTDLGETWIAHTGESITINSNTTVLTRVREGNEILATSSFTITKIDIIEPTIELVLEDEIPIGSDISLPTNYSVGPSGGSTTCTINGSSYTNINEIKEAGDYKIMCIVTSGNGTTNMVEKSIKIYEKIIEEGNDSPEEETLEGEDENE